MTPGRPLLGLLSPPAKAGVLLAWTVGRLLLLGLRGGAGVRGVCARLSLIAAGRGGPLGHE